MNPLFTTETRSTRRCTENPVGALCGGQKKCSAGFQPAGGLVDTKRVIQAQMPARRWRYHFFSRPRSSQTAGKTTVHCALWSAAACCRLCSHGVAPAPRRAQASLRTPKATPQEGWKNPCQIAKDFRLSSMEISVNLRVLRVSVVKKQLTYICSVVLLVASLVGAADKTNSASATAKAVPADLALLPGSAALQGSRAT